MRHVVLCAHLCTCLKFLWNAFFCMSKIHMTSQGEWFFAYLEGLQMYLNKELQKWIFYENFQEKSFFLKWVSAPTTQTTFFLERQWMSLDG